MAHEEDRATPFKISPIADLPQEAPEIRRVAGPENGLVATGTAGLLLNCLLNLGSILLAPKEPADAGPGLDAAARRLDPVAAERGRAAAPLLQTCVIVIPTLLIYPLAIVGGLRMKRFQSYRLALASSLLVMLPCSCAFLLGLPLGIWALVLLLDPTIKSKFQQLENG
jgi:hypothetical protein